jgi:hypothetical protein
MYNIYGYMIQIDESPQLHWNGQLFLVLIM